MLPDENQSVAWFAQLGLTLVPFTRRERGRGTIRWRLRAGARVFRVMGKSDFKSIEALWSAMYRAQPLFEWRYQQALALARDSLAWGKDQQWAMQEWLLGPRHRRSSFLLSRGYALDVHEHAWPGTVMRVTDMRHPVSLMGEPWHGAQPSIPSRVAVAEEALADSAWRVRLLTTARFDPQVPALFLAALQALLDNPGQAILAEQLPVAANAGTPARKRL